MARPGKMRALILLVAYTKCQKHPEPPGLLMEGTENRKKLSQ